MAAPRRIDAHHHHWQLARGDYDWLDASLAPLYRDFLPSDLAPLRATHGIDGTVLVQAAPTDAETDFLLKLADHEPSILGVVGWVDMASPSAPTRLARLARHPRFVGIRPMLQDIPRLDWLLDPALDACYPALLDLDLAFDALIRPTHLPLLLELTKRYPTLRIVVDHCAKPAIASGGWQPWADDIARLAAESDVCCKLSGLVTEAANDWRADDLLPYASHVLHCFGGERTLWGSDWPVLLLASDYAGWCALTETLLAEQPWAAHRAGILGDNAARFYRLDGSRR